MSTASLPSWVSSWYIFNLVILIPTYLFLSLRPRSLPGGDLAEYFGIFNFYIRADTLYGKIDDSALHCMYILGLFDTLFVLYICLNLRSSSHNPRFVLACFCRELFLLSKTLFYIMYSWPFIIAPWQIPVSILNGQWCIFPIVIITQICSRFIVALEKKA